MKVEYNAESDNSLFKEDKIKRYHRFRHGKGEIVGIEIWQARKYIISEILKYLERAKKLEV